MSKKSLEQRLHNIITEEDGACASCSGGGDAQIEGGDFTNGSDDAGPTAGYDKLMKGLKMVKRGKKAKTVKEQTDLILQASSYENDAHQAEDLNEMHRLLELARELRMDI